MKHFIIFITITFLLIAPSIAGNRDILPAQIVSYKFANDDLEEILIQISEEHNVRFAYRNSIFSTQMIYTGEFRNLPLSKMISDLLNEFGLCYTWMNNQFIIHADCGPTPITIRGTITSIDSSKVIPYASVAVYGSPGGIIANEKGYFEWEYQEGADSLIFISLGYENLCLSVDSLRKLNKVEVKLKQKVYEIPLVEVRRKDYVRRQVGNSRSEMLGSLYIDTQGQQTGIFIKNKKKLPGRLREVSYYLSDEGNIDAPFRIQIYSFNEGVPDSSLLQQPVIVRPNIENGWFKIDMRQFNIDFPIDGLVIAIEGIFPKEYTYFNAFPQEPEDMNATPTTLAYGQQLGYNNSYAGDTWHLSVNKKWFQLENQISGVMIYAIIEYEKIKKH